MTTPPAQATAAVTEVRVTLPLPPRSLGKGSSVHWRTVRRDYAQHQEWGYFALVAASLNVVQCWPAARMDICWMFAGIRPDDDNVTIRCAAYRDSAAAAGLVTNDRFIQVGAVTFVRVPRAEQCCVLSFVRIEEP